MIRLIICEDDPRFRRLLTKVLKNSQEIEVVGETARGEDVLGLVASISPDLLLLDLELPGISGTAVIQRLKEAGQLVEILILTTFTDEARLFECMRLGAAGYLVKGLAAKQLEAAVREVMAGGTVIDAKLAKRFWYYFASVQGKRDETYGLSEEELDVLTLVARGLSNPEAARILGASRRAVRLHLERIYRKLGVASRVEATVKALQAGLIKL